jgi:hypothetical protein
VVVVGIGVGKKTKFQVAVPPHVADILVSLSKRVVRERERERERDWLVVRKLMTKFWRWCLLYIYICIYVYMKREDDCDVRGVFSVTHDSVLERKHVTHTIKTSSALRI